MRVTLPAKYMVLKPASDGWFDQTALKLIQDPRDLTFVRHMAVMLFAVPPLALFLFVPGVFHWWIAPVYLANLIYWLMDRYVLMLHATSHRKLFKAPYQSLNHVIPWVLGPFFGQTPGTYFVHHIGMHHPENNLANDLSSTIYYQRDKFSHFLHYWAKFFVFGVPNLFMYLQRKKRSALIKKFLAGEAFFYTIVGLALWWNPGAALTVFVLPFVIMRWAMMAGNWAQHAFVDRDEPGNGYKNSVTLINARHNLRCFNDGYHAIHHEKQTLHWTEMPLDLEKDPAKYAREKAVVFAGLQGYQHVWILLMRKRYDKLAAAFVELGEESMTEEQIVAFLKSRTQQFPEPEVIPENLGAVA